MKNISSISIYVLGLLLVSFFMSCQSGTSEEEASNTNEEAETITGAQIVIKADSFVDSSGTFEIQPIENGEQMISSTAAGQWLAFDVDVPVAGRYKTEVLAVSTSSEPANAWVEDYIDNKDGRTYNITGVIPIANTGNKEPKSFHRDGSPLNTGVHKMKLHFDGGGIHVNALKFTLIKAHQNTPVTMIQNTEGKEWKVVWADEFDGEGIPDTTKWTYDIGDWGWGNNELQYYTENRPKNARQEDGNLIIESHKNDDGNKWTSARLTTRGKVTFLYGKIEFRAKVPPKRGNWAAGWTLGDEYVDEISWPYCGEIDILETVGFEIDDETGDGEAHASIHCGAYYFKLGNQPTSTIDVKNMVEEYHTYAVEWTPDGIKAFVDGIEYFSYDDNKSELAWPYDKAQNLILNLAMGGGWGGAQGMDDSYDSQKFIIDYVRVYELR